MAEYSSEFEKLGLFYLGKRWDLPTNKVQDEFVLYDSKDLVTHAVCIGMTGSGKTGLGISLIEEAAIDGVPSLVVDPKGDLTNLLLRFPQLRGEDFLPWIHVEDAHRQGVTPEEFARDQAKQWQQGLADWGQTPDRIQLPDRSCDFTIYTPGSDAGTPISIMASFGLPPASVLDDADLLRDRISTTATSLLSLLGIDADPIRSRDHILLTTILDHCWRQGVSLDLGGLIRMLQNPPVSNIGVMDLESFYPSRDRFELAMSLNNLLAAPSFSAWLAGEPMDIDRLLYSPQGRPRTSIFYIAHLSEVERTFFTALLLNQILGWMRGQSGTTSLRAVLYIDELFGYMPPVSEPATKKPLLTLLKQARAYGLGLVLATQNPVDLDYKGLSNTGTWFLGRLQTERDKERVLDGLEGAAAVSGSSLDREAISQVLSGIGRRVFLMHNVHESGPTLFHTRWALSYLAGPLTRPQIKRLRQQEPDQALPEALPVAAADPGTALTRPAPEGQRQLEPFSESRPVLPPDIPQTFLPLDRDIPPGTLLTYQPHLLALVRMNYVDSRKGLSAEEEFGLLADLRGDALGLDWSTATDTRIDRSALSAEPAGPGTFAPVPPEASRSKNYSAWARSLADHLYRSRRYRLFACRELESVSQPGEEERAFRIRLADRSREVRDARCEELRERYAARLRTWQDRVRRAEQKLQREQDEAANAKNQSMISWGTAVLSAVLGRKRLSATTVGRASTAMRGSSRASRQADDVRRAEDSLEDCQAQLEELELQLKEELRAIEQRLDVYALEIDELLLKPRRQDVQIRQVALAWVPSV